MAQTGFYGQARANPFEGLNLNMGGRIDVNGAYGPVSTWRAGASYLSAPTDTKIKASYGTAFKAPSLFELYGAGFFCAGNRNIQPEYSRGYEVGVEQGMFNRKVTAGITYFFNTYNGLIQCPPPFTSLQNVNNAQSEGFETFVQIRPFSWLDFNFEYTYTDRAQRRRQRAAGAPSAGPFNIRGEVRPWEDMRFGFGVLQVSSRNDFDAVSGAIIQPSPYTLLRFTAAYDVVPTCSSSLVPRMCSIGYTRSPKASRRLTSRPSSA